VPAPLGERVADTLEDRVDRTFDGFMTPSS
jgi:hypothetical protein